ISRSKKTGYRSDILPHEYLPVLRFTLRKKHLERLAVDCAFLEPPLFEYRHLDARHGLYAAPNDLALERVKLLMVPIGKLDEWDALGHLDHVGQRIRAEPLESEHARGSVGTDVPAALAARVRQRVLDRADAPSLVVKHQVVEHTPDGQLGVGLDGIVLQVLVAAVAVDEVLPVGIALPDAFAERKRHRRSLN